MRMKRVFRVIILSFIVCFMLSFYYHITDRSTHMSKEKPIISSIHTTTIVTAFFPFAKTKHTQDDYDQWLMNLLAYDNNPMVIFTCEKQFPLLLKLRNNRTNKMLSTVFILNFSSPFEMPPIKNLEGVFKRQLDNDPEKSLHSIDLYAVWCAKTFMLNLTSSLNPFRTDYFLWIDAGSFRDDKYRFTKWPDPEKMATIFYNNNRLLLSLINPLRKNSCRLDDNRKITIPRYDLVEGGIIGGSTSSIRPGIRA